MMALWVSKSHQEIQVPIPLSDDSVVGEQDGVGATLRPGQLGEDDAGHAAGDDDADHTL